MKRQPSLELMEHGRKIEAAMDESSTHEEFTIKQAKIWAEMLPSVRKELDEMEIEFKNILERK